MPNFDVQDINQAFSMSPELSTSQLNEVEQDGVLLTLDSGQFVCWEGDRCGHLPVVIEGLVRVYRVGENGREVTLYRIHPGESCILTASCILSQQDFPAHAVVEEPVRAIGIPAGVLMDWTDRYEVWRRFIFGMMSSRLDDIMEVVDAVTFKRLDVRLAEFLLTKFADNQSILTTHQELASELGTAREVISRVLKDFEHRRLVRLERGIIHPVDLSGIKRLSSH